MSLISEIKKFEYNGTVWLAYKKRLSENQNPEKGSQTKTKLKVNAENSL